MTAGPQKERTAAVLFAGFLTLALGGAGLLIAALAVGAERAWKGGSDDRKAGGDRRRGWFDEQRAWLALDNDRRARRAKERRDWLASGGNPDTEPVRPPRQQRIDESIRRATARTAVRGADFAAGAQDGWRAANATRRRGGTFRDVATSRPAPGGPSCQQCQRTGIPLDGGLCADCVRLLPRADSQPASVDPPAPTVEIPQRATDPRSQGLDGDEGEYVPPSRPDKPDDLIRHEHHTCDPHTCPHGHGSTSTSEGEFMASETDDLTNRYAEIAADGIDAYRARKALEEGSAESNATVLRTKLQQTKTTLSRIADLTDQLATERAALDVQVRDADEFATATGQSAQARQALDESRAVSTAMGDRLGEFSQGAVSAEEQVTHAADGLRVAEEAEDALRSAGADGRAVAPAGANA